MFCCIAVLICSKPIPLMGWGGGITIPPSLTLPSNEGGNEQSGSVHCLVCLSSSSPYITLSWFLCHIQILESNVKFLHITSVSVYHCLGHCLFSFYSYMFCTICKDSIELCLYLIQWIIKDYTSLLKSACFCDVKKKPTKIMSGLFLPLIY